MCRYYDGTSYFFISNKAVRLNGRSNIRNYSSLFIIAYILLNIMGIIPEYKRSENRKLIIDRLR